MDELILHPDFNDLEQAQMAFDQAVFQSVTGVTLIRHPYASELDLKAIYEQENGAGSSAGLLLMLTVDCLLPKQYGVRSKNPAALGPNDPLFAQLSKGYCAIIGEHSTNSMFYGLLHQRLPIEIIETGVIPL